MEIGGSVLIAGNSGGVAVESYRYWTGDRFAVLATEDNLLRIRPHLVQRIKISHDQIRQYPHISRIYKARIAGNAIIPFFKRNIYGCKATR